MFKKGFWFLQDEANEAGAGGAPEPQPAAPVVDNSPVDDSGVDWGDMSSEIDEVPGGFEDEPPAPEAEAPAAPPPEVTPVVEQPAAEQPPAQPEQTAPEPQPTPLTPEQTQQAEMQYMAQLEKLYQFNEETALKLQTEPEKVLPALAARLHLDVMKTVLAQVNGMLPQVMQQQSVATERETKAKLVFFDAWPELKGHEQQVLQVGKMYRQMNPGAAPDEAVRRIGEVAMAALGLSRTPAPQAPSQPQGGFRPAAPGRVNPPSGTPSLWEDMAAEDDD